MLGLQLNQNIVGNKKKLLAIVKYFALVNLYSIPLYLYQKGVYDTNFLANVVYKIVKMVLYPVENMIFHDKTRSIIYGDYVFYIDDTCSGFKSFYSIIPLMLATPKVDFIIKIKYSLVFGYILWILNLIRIVSVILSSAYINPIFLHGVLWPIFNIVFTITLYMVFLKNYNIININIISWVKNNKYLFSRG